MSRRRWAISSLALVAALVAPAAIVVPTAPAAAAKRSPAKTWVLRDTTVNPDHVAPPLEFDELTVVSGHAAFTWRNADGTFAAHYDAAYTPPSPQLTAGRTYEVNVTFAGAITVDRAALFTGAGVVLVVNRTWERSIGVDQSCHVASETDSTLTCDEPATKSGTLRFAAPRAGKAGGTFDVTVGITSCGACAVRYQYELAGPDGSAPTTASTVPSTAPSTDAPSAHLPVVVIPGVAGTTLNSRTAIASSEVWPNAKLAGRDGLQLEDDGITPVTDAQIRTGDILRGGPAHHFADTYGPLLASLRKQGYREGTDLFTFPYDWRLDNSLHFDDLDAVIKGALEKSGKDRVVLVAHNMGGLIARQYVLSSPLRAATVDATVTLGTPYFGSPRVFYGLMEGDSFGNPNVSEDLMKVLLQHFPSAYQMLPRYPFVRDGSSGELVPLFLTYLTEYPGVQWLSPEDRYVQSSETWTLIPRLVDGALQFNGPGGLPAAPATSPVKQYVVIGNGVRTLTGYTMVDDPASSITTAGGHHVSLAPRYGDGDGTVALEGAQLGGATATYYVRSTAKDSTVNGDLPASTRVQKIVSQILAGNPPRQERLAHKSGKLRDLEPTDLSVS